MMITMTNNYHGTSVRLRVKPWGRLSLGQVARARRELCGVEGCTCGGSLGERGPQPGGLEVQDLPDGMARILAKPEVIL
jgi:hypothetical protein